MSDLGWLSYGAWAVLICAWIAGRRRGRASIWPWWRYALVLPALVQLIVYGWFASGLVMALVLPVVFLHRRLKTERRRWATAGYQWYGAGQSKRDRVRANLLEATRDTVCAIALGVGLVAIVQDVCLVLDANDFEHIDGFEHVVIAVRDQISAAIHPSLPKVVGFIAVMVAASLLLPGIRLVRAHKKIRRRVVGLLLVLQTATAFTFLSGYEAGVWRRAEIARHREGAAKRLARLDELRRSAVADRWSKAAIHSIPSSARTDLAVLVGRLNAEYASEAVWRGVLREIISSAPPRDPALEDGDPRGPPEPPDSEGGRGPRMGGPGDGPAPPSDSSDSPRREPRGSPDVPISPAEARARAALSRVDMVDVPAVDLESLGVEEQRAEAAAGEIHRSLDLAVRELLPEGFVGILIDGLTSRWDLGRLGSSTIARLFSRPSESPPQPWLMDLHGPLEAHPARKVEPVVIPEPDQLPPDIGGLGWKPRDTEPCQRCTCKEYPSGRQVPLLSCAGKPGFERCCAGY